jgi:enamine deaminase RidA (YjgF/YER057c/UK114 family)
MKFMIASATPPSQRLRELAIVLPPPRTPIANFVSYKRCGDLLYLSGQGPVTNDGLRYAGKVGDEITVEQAYEHAKLATINLLASANSALGSLDNVQEIIKVLGFVNAAPDFRDHPRVINGCSDLLLAIFGPDRGAHARSAIGVGSLPNQITVEIEMVLKAPR